MKYCPKCGAPNDDSAKTCKQCGFMLPPPSKSENWETIKKPTVPEHCIRCGEPLEGRRYCEKCGADQLAETFVQSQPLSDRNNGTKSYVIAGICAILFGMYGVHNFYTCHYGKAVAQLILTLLGIGFLVSTIWAWIEGFNFLAHKKPYYLTDVNGVPLVA